MIANRYDVILFDFDGTLCDTREAVKACLMATVEGLTGRAPSDAEVTAVVGGGLSIRDTFRALTGVQGRPGGGDMEPLVSHYRARYPAIAASRTVLYAGVKETLATIAMCCRGCVMVSNKGGAAIHQPVERFGIDVFDMVVAEHPTFRPSRIPRCLRT